MYMKAPRVLKTYKYVCSGNSKWFSVIGAFRAAWGRVKDEAEQLRRCQITPKAIFSILN